MGFKDLGVTRYTAKLDLTDTVPTEFTVPTLVRVLRVGFIVTTDVTGNIELTFTHRLAGADALGGGGEPDITLTVTSGPSEGEVFIREAEDFPNDDPQVYIPGEALEVISDSVPSTGDAIVFVEFEQQPFTDNGFVRSAPTASVTTPADSTTLANLVEVIPA